VLCCLIAGLHIAPHRAHAGQAENEAEAQRLSQEIGRLANRNAWAGVARGYAALIEVPGAQLTVQHHLLGAHAAQSAGDVNVVWTCLNRALEVDPRHEDALMWWATLLANYGEVSLKVPKRYNGEAALIGQDFSFNPEHVRVFQAAQAALDENRSYTGLLPLGRYQLGAQKFEIIGGPLVEVKLKPQK